MVMKNILFADMGVQDLSSQGLVVLITSGIEGKDALLRAYQEAFNFPYFRMNWDALQDCLRDLSWINAERVVIIHDDLPSLEESDLRTYLAILSDTVIEWADDSGKKFEVVFPLHLKARLSEIVGGVKA
jgi:hypothetical protein